MRCKYCRRKLPNKNLKTKKMCIWCDGDYHHKKEEDIYTKEEMKKIEKLASEKGKVYDSDIKAKEYLDKLFGIKEEK